MKTSILLFGFILFVNGFVNAQAQKTEEAPVLEKQMATYICKQLDSVDVKSLKTPEEKNKAMQGVFIKALGIFQTKIMDDPRFKGKTTYEEGQEVGRAVGKKVYELLLESCPVVKSLSTTTKQQQ